MSDGLNKAEKLAVARKKVRIFQYKFYIYKMKKYN